MAKYWHTLSHVEIEKELNTNFHFGLSVREAELRLKKYGQNKLSEGKGDNLFIVFFRQFQSPLVYILLFACAAVFALGDYTDGFVILIVLLLNATVGSVQEGRAQNTLLALKKFTETKATVLRDGKEVIAPDVDVVPGDIVILQEGEKVPADCRVILSNNLMIDEASLTGESEPVAKKTDALKNEKLHTAEQKNMVFKGTYVVFGNARVVVAETGLNTVIGKISAQIEELDTEIPLKTNIRNLSRLIVVAVIVISVALFFASIAVGYPLKETLILMIAFAVSIVPEGLPVVLTLVLATGVWRMAKRNALVKRLQAVEALGQAQIIALDKTGTITKNEMVVQKIFVNDKTFDVSGIGYELEGEFTLEDDVGKEKPEIISPLDYSELLLFGKASLFCANAQVAFNEETKRWQVTGDPTEAALAVLGQKIGFKKDELEIANPLLREIPFDFKTKYHMTVHRVEEKGFLTITGAPEMVIPLCEKIWTDKGEEAFTKKKREEMEDVFNKFSRRGLRVIAVAIKENIKLDKEKEDQQDFKTEKLTFVGFCAMKDALRTEVKPVVERAREAGLKIVMITGDYKLTAQAIAKEAGIWQEGDEFLTGEDMEGITQADLSKKLKKVSVFARVTPEHKLKIVQAYKKRGEVIAMVGDGVNDTPSLVVADLGVAMGRIGTEVAREASDIVLLDDNVSTIISAIEEGRSIYKTIKKVILYLFSTSFGEVLTIGGALLIGYPLPLTASQIIWLNLVTDGPYDVALAMEPKELGLLKKGFRKPKKYIVDGLMVQRMFTMAIPMMIGTLWLFKGYYANDLVKGWTIALTSLSIFQWFNVWNCRSDEKSIFQMNPFSNKFIVWATILVIFLQISVVYAPFMQKIFSTTSLTLSEWGLIFLVASSILVTEEIRKLVYRLAKSGERHN